ncbi:MAG: helix-turn-helix domain-containing protein [Deltaproteobacteria bacterium]|nr:helix-turn-helix domain-containing protein [Deltaproteobacteria bacterium]
MSAGTPKLLTVDEALEVLRISRSKLHQLVRQGELAAVRLGRRTPFRPEALSELVASHETRAEKASARLPGLR